MSRDFNQRIEIIEYCDRLADLEYQILELLRQKEELSINSIVDVLSTITEETFNIEDYLTRL